jgi:hypothetical protein
MPIAWRMPVLVCPLRPAHDNPSGLTLRADSHLIAERGQVRLGV